MHLEIVGQNIFGPRFRAGRHIGGALRHAIAQLRAEGGVDGPFDLSTPAVPDAVQALCAIDYKRFGYGAKA